MRNKTENQPYPRLLQPLPMPKEAWKDISIDFIEGLPKFKRKDVIIVLVDRFFKYRHLLSLTHPFSKVDVTKLFINIMYKLHVLQQFIVTDTDKVFTSLFWKVLFKILGVKLHMSSAYHPQSDG